MKRLTKMHFPLALAIFVTLLLATSCIYGYGPAPAPTQPYQSPPVTPAPSAPYQAAQPVINSFNASPTIIGPGQSATLSWTVTGANTVTIDPAIGATTTSGSQVVSPATTTTYILTATGPGGVATDTTVVSVVPQAMSSYSQYPAYPVYPAVPATCVPVIQYFEINPPIVSPGETAIMSWNVTNASSVSIDQGIGPVPPVGSITLLPYYVTYYTLTAANSCGNVTAVATVTVYPLGYQYIYPYPSGFFPPFHGSEEFHERNESRAEERNESTPPPSPPHSSPPPTHEENIPNRGNLPHINDFQTTPPHIEMGNSARIKWNVSGANSVNISPGIGPVAPSGEMTVRPDQTTNYKITAGNSAGVVEHSSQITVPRTFEGGENRGGERR